MSCEKLFDRILSDASVRAPGAVEAAARNELFNVLDEFFRNTSIWQEDIPLGVVTTKTTYYLDSNEWVAVINELISVVNVDVIGVNATMQQPGVLVLQNAPIADTIYTVKVVLTIADVMDDDGYPQVPEWIATKYREGVKDGVLARLCSQPAKPYFNEKMAAYHGMRFRSAMASAYADGRQMNTFNSQRWHYPQSFATGRR